MGLLAVYYLKAFYGVAKVDAIEPDPARRKLAKTFGVGTVYAPDEVEFNRYDYGIECSARNAAFALLQQAVKPGQSICVLSDGNKETLVLQPEFYEKELQVMGSSDGWDYPEHFQRYFEAVQRAEYVKQIFDMDIQRDDLIQAFSELSERTINPLKNCCHISTIKVLNRCVNIGNRERTGETCLTIKLMKIYRYGCLT